MSFVSKVASIAAVALGLIGVVTSTPGFAQQLDQQSNVRIAMSVPAIAVTPDLSPATLPAPAPIASATTALQGSDDPDPDYSTLEAAIADQPTPTEVSDALHCLAASVYYESKGEPLAGQLAVAEVILNRARSGRFPTSVCSVVTQPGQFSFIKGGRVPEVGSNPQWKTAMAIAQVALADAWDSPAPKALFFHARRVSPGWRAIKVAAIGNHVFFR